MGRKPLPLASFVLFLLFTVAYSESEEVSKALVDFMVTLSPGDIKNEPNFGWNSSSDPCTDKWRGVSCDSQGQAVKKIILDKFNLSGVLDVTSLCKTNSLAVLSLNENNLAGTLSDDISKCRYLTHLYLSQNRFSGNLPGNLSRLSNLKRVNISNNGFSGQLPDMSRISGLLSFLAQNNNLSGTIPVFDFSNLSQFNVSNNNLTGTIPDVNNRFDQSSFSGNPGLCGSPLPNTCPFTPSKNREKKKFKTKYLIYAGYAILGLAIVLLIFLQCRKKIKKKDKKPNDMVLEKSGSSKSMSPSGTSIDRYKSGTEYSITSLESGNPSANSLVVLSSPVVNGLKFEDLLQAPAELVGRGKHGSVYKVVLNDGTNVAVKRVKDWGIARPDFKKRMLRLDKVKHPNLLPALAYYCSKQEKLLVYEFQKNGSLFKLLQESQNGELFDWGGRLTISAQIAEVLSFMHKKLQDDKIAHGNLKLSNILLNNNMEPCISEYGLMVIDNNSTHSFRVKDNDSIKSDDPIKGRAYSTFKVDVYAFGVVLLELLTGKLVNNTGFDLAGWVHSVVREEWTVEVFDKALVSDGANEGRMVNLLQVALKCTNPTPEARPNMDQVADMINSIKEEDDKSINSDP